MVNSDVCIGLIGSDYGNILESGISPTEYEYDLFNRAHNDALVFVKNRETRDDEVYEFIDKIGDEHTYQTFNDLYELFDEVRKSLIDFLESDISKITISQYMKLFDVSRNTAISDLNDLVSKRLVRKFKDAKTNVYKIL